jgi:hypothetical protein
MQSLSSCSPVNRLRSSSWSSGGDVGDLGLDLGFLGVVVFLAGHLVEHLDVVDRGHQRVVGVEVVLGCWRTRH